MSVEDATPRVWMLPEEPPVGTVVEVEGHRFERGEGFWSPVQLAPEERQYASQEWSWPELLKSGQVVEVVPTPAEELAERLANLASHLRAHPELQPVNVSREDFHVSAGSRPPEDLAAWAGSMGDPSLHVRLIGSDAYVYVVGWLGGRVERVWDTVPGFYEFLVERGVWPADAKTVDVPVRLLATFVIESASVKAGA